MIKNTIKNKASTNNWRTPVTKDLVSIKSIMGKQTHIKIIFFKLSEITSRFFIAKIFLTTNKEYINDGKELIKSAIDRKSVV